MEFPPELARSYDLISRLGSGAMGVVFRARNRVLERDVAIKLLSAEASAEADIRVRFTEEARLVARVRHPNVVQVLDSGVTADGVLFVVYEYLAGNDLAARLARDGPMAPERAATLIAGVLDGLAAVHAAGIVHRDLKPANILVTHDSVPRIVDFGIARNLLDARVRTRTGVILGTPQYLSPEVILGQDIGPASDVYAVGALLFELVAGRTPFVEDTVAKLLSSHLHVPPPRLDALIGAVPHALADAVERALAKAPDSRPTPADLRALLLVDAAASPGPAGVPAPGSSGRITSVRSGVRSGLSRVNSSASRSRSLSSRPSLALSQAPPERAVLPRAAALAVVLGAFAIGGAALRFRSGPDVPIRVPARAAQSSTATPRPESAARRTLDGQRVAQVQLGHLVLLKESERRAGDPAAVLRRALYLRGALDALAPVASDCPPPWLAATWALAALLDAETRTTGAAADGPLLAHRARAMRCREELAPAVQAAYGAPAPPGELARRVVAGTLPPAEGHLLVLAAIADDAPPTGPAHAGWSAELDASITSIRDISSHIEGKSETLQAWRALQTTWSEFFQREAAASARSQDREAFWADFSELLDRLRPHEKAMASLHVKLAHGVPAVVPLIAMCAADQGQRWLYAHETETLRVQREAARAKAAAGTNAPSPAARPLGRREPLAPRELGLRWIDLSWLTLLDPAAMDRARRNATAPYRPGVFDLHEMRAFFRARTRLLPESLVFTIRLEETAYGSYDWGQERNSERVRALASPSR